MHYLRRSLIQAYLARMENGGTSKRGAFAKGARFFQSHHRPQFCGSDPSLPSSGTEGQSKRVFEKARFFQGHRQPNFCGSDPSLPSPGSGGPSKRAFGKARARIFQGLYRPHSCGSDPSLPSSGPILSKSRRNDKKSYVAKIDTGNLNFQIFEVINTYK